MRTKIVITAVAALALAGAGAGTAVALSSDDGDATVSGPGADGARRAALAAFPGSRANSVERDGEDGATWEVEITRPDGTTVDVRLDDHYKLVVVEGDSDAHDG